MRYHNCIHDASLGLPYAGLVEIATLVMISSLAQAGMAHDTGAPIFKGRWVSGLPH